MLAAEIVRTSFYTHFEPLGSQSPKSTKKKSQNTEPEDKVKESKSFIYTAWQNVLTVLLSNYYLKLEFMCFCLLPCLN